MSAGAEVEVQTSITKVALQRKEQKQVLNSGREQGDAQSDDARKDETEGTRQRSMKEKGVMEEDAGLPANMGTGPGECGPREDFLHDISLDLGIKKTKDIGPISQVDNLGKEVAQSPLGCVTSGNTSQGNSLEKMEGSEGNGVRRFRGRKTVMTNLRVSSPTLKRAAKPRSHKIVFGSMLQGNDIVPPIHSEFEIQRITTLVDQKEAHVMDPMNPLEPKGPRESPEVVLDYNDPKERWYEVQEAVDMEDQAGHIHNEPMDSGQ